MNRVQASACPRRSVVAACRALPASVSLILMLVALACASAAPQARAGSFDWRSRGILFRVVADVPVDAGTGSAARSAERRVGQEGVSTGSSGWGPEHSKK